MISDALNITGTSMQKMPRSADLVEIGRKKVSEIQDGSQDNSGKNAINPEEVLNKIKELTEDGLYSVRFESDQTTKQMVVKIVDSETEEVIRQLPPEELLELRKVLSDFKGNLIDTTT